MSGAHLSPPPTMKKLIIFLLVTAILGFVFALYQVNWNPERLFGNKPGRAKVKEGSSQKVPTTIHEFSPPSYMPPVRIRTQPAKETEESPPPPPVVQVVTWT